ncbi:MAG: hypothetical protein Q9M36_11360 [Sulfurovum sp.]|nr:hypothetical protein [Sulfurovum sp.]
MEMLAENEPEAHIKAIQHHESHHARALRPCNYGFSEKTAEFNALDDD